MRRIVAPRPNAGLDARAAWVPTRAMRTRPAPVLFLALAGLLSSTGCGGATSSTSTPTSTGNANGSSFVIDLQRPYAAGQRFRASNEVVREEAQRVTMGEQLVEESSHTTSITLTSTVEIVEVTAEGRAALLRHTVEAASLAVDGAPAPFVQPGQVIEVRTGATADEAVVSIDGSPASTELREALRSVLTLSHGGADEDRLFGSTSPRSVGERWQPDLAAIAADLARATPFRVDAARMSGEMTLLEHRPGEGLVIEGAIVASDAQMTELPPGATIAQSQLTVAMGGVFPDDVTQQATTEAKGLELRIAMNIPTPQGTVLMQMDMRMRGRLTRTAL